MTDGNKLQMEIFHPDELAPSLRSILSASPDGTCREQGRIWLMSGQAVFSFPDDERGNMLADAICHRFETDTAPPRDSVSLFRRYFRDPVFEPDRAMLKKYGITPSAKRCAVVFRAYHPLGKEMASVFADMAPVESDEYVIPEDYRTVIFVKSLHNQTDEELIEYTDAVIGTMESEGITGVRAGIGSDASDLPGLKISCREALGALSVGMRYHSEDHVFVYGKQVLDRIIECIPPDKQRMIRNEFLSRCPAGILTGEMLETVRVFFENDLNLTAASRQLFIHRNTLNYRLDKIRKETGLDLRSFQDAVIFRIVSSIPEDTDKAF